MRPAYCSPIAHHFLSDPKHVKRQGQVLFRPARHYRKDGKIRVSWSVSGARFCSRDVEEMRKQMDEQLERDGRFTMATLTNPSVFHLGRYLLTQSPDFEVQGSMTGGEAEVVAIRDGRRDPRFRRQRPV